MRVIQGVTLLLFAICGSEVSVAEEQAVSFSKQILPILSDKCFVCHGPDAAEHGDDMRRLDSLDAATQLIGGTRAIDPENPERSQLLVRIHSADDPMPPTEADKQLTQHERDLLTKWIRQGGTYTQHWAFVPPQKIMPPGFSGDNGSDVIDAFIHQQLADRKIDFAPQAEDNVLARRLALVLTGLPPEQQQLKDYQASQAADRYQVLVEQLLASGRYGEHQARYWLDAVRYGDTHGLHLDNRRGIYPYRDWVVRAFNQNLPLDEFITWQLAGDLLPDSSVEQRIATGFVRMNPTTSEGGAIPAEFQAKNNFDRTETLGTVLLGMSLTCARCHTHKYDPIPQREYYQLLAFFNSTAEPSMDGNKYEYGPVLKVPTDQDAWDTWQVLLKQRAQLIVKATSQISDAKPLPESELSAWRTGDDAEKLSLLSKPDGPFANTDIQKEALSLSQRLSETEAAFTTTLVAQELPQPRVTQLLRRGEYNLPVGDPLQPDVLSVMGQLPTDAPRNRLGLARWLTSRQHPLVARVLVNRIWQRVFGYGLVRTPEDFGVQGQHPTHPELLDWLAVELQDSDWNLKHILRLMVNSRTFRQSSAYRTDVEDPENRLFARASTYRLDAEVLRDIGLWASRLLDPHMGGEGVKPYQPAGMWLAMAHPASNTKKYERDTGNRLYRRSLYVYWKRTSPHPMMTLFDAPDRESSCVRRSRTNTSLQSLGLLNEIQRIEMARKLAERLQQERQKDDQRIDYLFELLASRKPSTVEKQTCRNLLQTMLDRYTTHPEEALRLLSTGDADRDSSLDAAESAAWTQVAATVMAADATILMY